MAAWRLLIIPLMHLNETPATTSSAMSDSWGKTMKWAILHVLQLTAACGAFYLFFQFHVSRGRSPKDAEFLTLNLANLILMMPLFTLKLEGDKWHPRRRTTIALRFLLFCLAFGSLYLVFASRPGQMTRHLGEIAYAIIFISTVTINAWRQRGDEQASHRPPTDLKRKATPAQLIAACLVAIAFIVAAIVNIIANWH